MTQQLSEILRRILGLSGKNFTLRDPLVRQTVLRMVTVVGLVGLVIWGTYAGIPITTSSTSGNAASNDSERVSLLNGVRLRNEEILPLRSVLAKANLNDYTIAKGELLVAASRQNVYLEALQQAKWKPIASEKTQEEALRRAASPFLTSDLRSERLRLASMERISRHLETFAGIAEAQVSYEVGTPTGFSRQTTPRAVVTVRTLPGETLSVERAAAVLDYVLGSIAGLKPEQTVLIDPDTSKRFTGDSLRDAAVGPDAAQLRRIAAAEQLEKQVADALNSLNEPEIRITVTATPAPRIAAILPISSVAPTTNSPKPSSSPEHPTEDSTTMAIGAVDVADVDALARSAQRVLKPVASDSVCDVCLELAATDTSSTALGTSLSANQPISLPTSDSETPSVLPLSESTSSSVCSLDLGTATNSEMDMESGLDIKSRAIANTKETENAEPVGDPQWNELPWPKPVTSESQLSDTYHFAVNVEIPGRWFARRWRERSDASAIVSGTPEERDLACTRFERQELNFIAQRLQTILPSDGTCDLSVSASGDGLAAILGDENVLTTLRGEMTTAERRGWILAGLMGLCFVGLLGYTYRQRRNFRYVTTESTTGENPIATDQTSLREYDAVYPEEESEDSFESVSTAASNGISNGVSRVSDGTPDIPSRGTPEAVTGGSSDAVSGERTEDGTREDEAADTSSRPFSRTGDAQRLERRVERSPLTFLTMCEPARLVRSLVAERPQSIALVLAYLPANQAGLCLELMPPRIQVEVLRRLVDFDSPDMSIVDEVFRVLCDRISSDGSDGPSFSTAENSVPLSSDPAMTRRIPMDPMARVTEILDVVPQEVGLRILENLSAYAPSLVPQLRRSTLEFRYEDLDRLSPDSLGVLLRSLDDDLLCIAMLGADPEQTERWLKAFPGNRATQLRRRLTGGETGPIRLGDVEEARQRIGQIATHWILEGRMSPPRRAA